MATNPGYNRYQQIMDEYAAYEPGPGESDIKSQKMAMAGNMTEKAFDADAAKDMAFTQAGISAQLASHEADLSLRNESEARAQEYDYGMMSMGSQVDQQNNFANAQYDRDIGMLNATGVQDRKNIKEMANQERLNEINRGVQGRLNIGAQGQVDRENYKTKTDNDIRMQDAKGEDDRKTIGASGEQDRLTIGAQGDQDVRKIGATGDQERKTLEKADELTAKKANRQSARARSLARSF